MIPTNQPVVRADEEDRIYRTRKEKIEAILQEIEREPDAAGNGDAKYVQTCHVDVMISHCRYDS